MGGNRGVGGNLPNGHFFVDFFHRVFSGILKFKIPTRPHICLNGWYRRYRKSSVLDWIFLYRFKIYRAAPAHEAGAAG